VRRGRTMPRPHGSSRPAPPHLARISARAGRGRAQEQERGRAVEACAALAGELRAGRPPQVALSVAAGVATGGTAEGLRGASSGLEVGSDAVGLLERGANGTACPALLRGLAACWALCSSTGSGLASAVERLELAERDAQARRRAVAAELAGPRATAGLLAVLPVLGLALGSALGAAPLRWLLTTPAGLGCLAAGVALDVAGLLWTRRMVARAAGAG
jgi:tight adherence protein B